MKNLLVRLALVCICSSLICLVFSGQSSAKIDPATCMGAWLFNEDGEDTVSDISGNENHGAIKGNPKWEKGKFGLGLRLDGQGDYVDCGDKDSLDVGTSDFSIVAWVQCDKYTPAGWRHDIVNKLDTTEPRHGYTLSVRGVEDAGNQGKPIVILGLGQGTGQHMFGKSSITDDTWHHVALTADRDGSMILYRDGEIEVQASIAAGVNSDENNAKNFNIGAQGGSQTIQALIDEVAIFNVAFSQDEVKDIMTNGLESALGLVAVSARGKLAATWAGIKDDPLPTELHYRSTLWVRYVHQDGRSNVMGNEEKVTGISVDGGGKELHVGSGCPYKTIQAAADEAQPGDLIMVHAGIYRERVAPPRGGLPGQPIVYRGDPEGGTIIKGSEIWNLDWQSAGSGIYYGVPDESLFDDVSPEYVDSHNPFEVELSSTPHGREGKREVERQGKGDPDLVYTCGQVFVNGERYLEVPYPEEMEGKPKTWHYESSTHRIYINFGNLNPKEQQTEITTRRRIFAPKEVGLGYITVEGFVMEHCGNQYPTNFWAEPKWAQRGALGTEVGHHWIIRRNTIRLCKTFAIDAGYVGFKQNFRNVKGHLIEYNYIMDNGSAGILSCGSVDQVIRHNVIVNNNTLGFIGHKRYEDGGIKCHFFQNGLIESNYIANNQLTFGIWLDNQHPDCRITRNVILKNGRAGIFLEMSDYDWDRVLIDNNVIMGNRENQIYMHDASGATFIHNLFANTPGIPREPSENYSFSRAGRGIFIKQVTQRTASRNISFYSNLFLNHDRSMHDINYPEGRSGPKRGDYNVYDTQVGARVFCINRATSTSLSNSELVDRVHMDLGAASPGKSTISDSSGARLTLKEWTAFWASHKQDFDAHSLLNQGSSASYNPRIHELTLNITFDPGQISSQSPDRVGEDFFGHPVPQNGQALPGPFQDLRQGINRFKIWNGLPVPETF